MAAVFTWLYLGGLATVRNDLESRVPAEIEGGINIITLHPVEALIFMVKFSVLLGIVAVFPVALYYAWPALRERVASSPGGSTRCISGRARCSAGCSAASRSGTPTSHRTRYHRVARHRRRAGEHDHHLSGERLPLARRLHHRRDRLPRGHPDRDDPAEQRRDPVRCLPEPLARGHRRDHAVRGGVHPLPT